MLFPSECLRCFVPAARRLMPCAHLHTSLLSLLISTAVTGVGMAGSPELIFEYDPGKPGSYQDGVLTASEGSGVPLAGQAVPGVQPISSNISPPAPDEFAPPVFREAGSDGSPRAFLSFEKFGFLYPVEADIAEGRELNQGLILNTDGEAKGYSMEGWIRLRSDLQTLNMAPLLGGGRTESANAFLWIMHDGRLLSTTAVVAPEYESGGQLVKGDPDSIHKASTFFSENEIPRDEWIHLVKVHDVLKNQIRFYCNGSLISETEGPQVPSGWIYAGSADMQGSVGGPATTVVRGFDFGLFRLYRGVLSETEIQANYQKISNPQ